MTSPPVVPPASHSSAYAASGVNYDVLDPAKRLAQRAAEGTAPQLLSRGYAEEPGTRGESAYVIDAGDHYLATLSEGLGTKNLVADAVRALTGRSHYGQIARDTVATILNDLATVGAVPLVVSAYWATSTSDWFLDTERVADLVSGWASACAEAGATWGGGETQAIGGIVAPGAITLAGSALGVIRPKERLLRGDRLRDGDAILVAPSTGIHANGLTLARRVANALPRGYATPLPGDAEGRSFGEALLDPSPLYGPLVEGLQASGIDLHYAAHITGHGWRKLMRAGPPFTYMVSQVPSVPPVLAFLQQHLGLTDAEAYATFNMGGGFALFLPAGQVEQAMATAALSGFTLLRTGAVHTGPKQVILHPIDVTYGAEDLQIR